MIENFLVYDGKDTSLGTNGFRFYLKDEKPELSFDFDQIVYQPEMEEYVFTYNENHNIADLNELQKAEIEDYLQYWMEEHDYNVYAYMPPYNLYEGNMPKSTAEENGYLYRINEVPTTACPKWDDEKQKWVNCKLIIFDDGTPIYYPDYICSRCVKGFTDEEFEQLPERPSEYHLWDLANDVWYDGRTLEQAKMDSAISIRADFEIRRHEHSPYKYFIGDYENMTWDYQLDEAQHWLNDNTWDTPYIDTFLSHRNDDDIPTKEEFCQDIINNHREFVIAMAEINAEQWNYLSQLKHAETNERCIEISNEAKRFCQGLSTGVQDVLE